jgi:hypothetical protein
MNARQRSVGFLCCWLCAGGMTASGLNSSNAAPVLTPPTARPSDSSSARGTSLFPALTGLSTWYSRESCAREGTGGAEIRMANGKPLDDSSMTCALWRTNAAGRVLRPTGALYRVTCLATGRSVLVRWTDNGPGLGPRARGVVIDLTPAAMRALAGSRGLRAGRVRVKVESL